MYHATSSGFDFENCEPIFIWIDHCRMFENQLVILNPKYNVVRKNNRFSITDNEEYVNISENFRLNFLALCGRNGVGKSTFLRMLSGRHSFESEYTVCWFDSDGQVACSESIDLTLRGNKVSLESRVHNFKLSSLCGNGNLGEENHVRRSLLDVYSANPEIFNLHDKPVFDGFHLDRATGTTDLHKFEKELSEHLGIEDDSNFDQLKSILEEHPTFHVLASIANDSTFRDVGNKLDLKHPITYEVIFQALRDEESDALDKELMKLIYKEGVRGGGLKKGKDNVFSSSEPNWVRYGIRDHSKIKRKVVELSGSIDDWMNRKLKNLKSELWEKEHLNLHVWENRLMQIVDFVPYKEHEGNLSHLWDLSDGEFSQIKVLFDLAAMIMPEHVCWFYFDDIDDYLHPEWKRNLVNRIASTYLEFTGRVARFSKVKRYAEKTLTCVIATHSPFVLSDLPRHSVLQFVKFENGKTSIKRSEKNTFAGNIGELFHTEFFMESTIGEFAKQEIRRAIKKLDGSPSTDEVNQIRKLFSMVGDDVLKNLLLEKLHHAES